MSVNQSLCSHFKACKLRRAQEDSQTTIDEAIDQLSPASTTDDDSGTDGVTSATDTECSTSDASSMAGTASLHAVANASYSTSLETSSCLAPQITRPSTSSASAMTCDPQNPN